MRKVTRVNETRARIERDLRRIRIATWLYLAAMGIMCALIIAAVVWL